MSSIRPTTGEFRSDAHRAIAMAFHAPAMLGYVPDSNENRKKQRPSTHLYGVSPPASPQASLAKFRVHLFDQGQSGGCVGHAFAQAIATATNAQGTPLGFVPSPGRLYRLNRVLERTNNTTPLADTGSMPTDTITVAQNWGISAIGPMAPDGRFSDVWGPDDNNFGVPPNLNNEPDLSELEQTGLCLLAGQYRIDETPGSSPISQLQAAIAALSPVVVGLFVDTAFMSWNPANGPISKIDLGDRQGGGHCIVSDYYYLDPTGQVIVGGPNSWGSGWPAASAPVPGSPFWSPGCWEMTASCLLTAVSDLIVVSPKRLV